MAALASSPCCALWPSAGNGGEPTQQSQVPSHLLQLQPLRQAGLLLLLLIPQLQLQPSHVVLDALDAPSLQEVQLCASGSWAQASQA